MFDAVLKKDNDPISDAEIVEFPIPEDRYKKTIRALNKIQIGSVLEQDCCVADLRSADCPALRRMIGRMVSVDELDWLGKQLESFDRYELLQFNAAAERFDISSAGEMIDLALRSREVTVCLCQDRDEGNFCPILLGFWLLKFLKKSAFFAKLL